MRAIVCGAGQVGYHIASYLAREQNDVTVIDLKPELVYKINEDMDATGMIGHASNPDVLARAGARDADLLIAVTHSDEVNMIACQVAHSLFNVPKKVARVRSSAYLDPSWSNLFSRAHMPIDVIISPEQEVAYDILERLKIPGTSNVINLLDRKAYAVTVLCEESCPILHTPMRQIRELFPDLNAKICLITRQGQPVLPNLDTQLLPGDEVMIVVSQEHLQRALTVFGHTEKEAHNILVVGGGNIGRQLAELLHNEYNNMSLKIIEANLQQAERLSSRLPDDIIIHGDGLDKRILEEVGIHDIETIVTVTNDDEVNILCALLAKEYGCPRAITLVNKEVYNSLISAFRIDAIVSPRTITAATIMKHVRRGRIHAVYDILDGYGELIEARASETCQVVHKPISKLNLPPHAVVAMIMREGELILPNGDTVIEPEDMVVMFSAQTDTKFIEQLFSFKFDLM